MKKLFLLLMAVILTTTCAMAQAGLIKGTVVSASDNEPLPGATVIASNGQGVATNLDGEFSIRVEAGTELRISYVGYLEQKVAATDGMVIKLKEGDTRLDEVVVTGYGSTKKLGSVVGSVSVVSEKVLENTPSSNFVDALQGQVSGLNIFSNSGDPSIVPSAIRIRGVNSLNARTTPLFILDGAPVTDAIFTTLNPSDIANVTVLKDASSTAIYGSRAANGVIVITTKKGGYGEDAKVTVGASVGWSELARDLVKVMDSYQYIDFRNKVGMPVSQDVVDLVNKYGFNTNWADELIDDRALLYNVEARVQGGTEKTRYYLSLNHYNMDGLVASSGIRRESFNVSLDSKVKDWLQVGFTGNFGYQRYHTNSAATGYYFQNAFQSATEVLPYDVPYYYSIDDNGNLIKGEKATWYRYSGLNDPNYLTDLAKSNRSNVTANMNLYEQITPIKGLTIRTQQAMNAFDYRNSGHRDAHTNVVTPMGDTTQNLEMAAYTTESFQRWYRFTYTNTVEYKFDINQLHYFTFMAGQESIVRKSNQFDVRTNNQPTPLQWLLTNGTTVTMENVGQEIEKETMNSYFFNMSYEYDGRYFVDASLRRDGSSLFAPGHRWGTFYAVGLMWNAKKENFLKPVNWLDDLKVRFNYGSTGNNGIGNYGYQGVAGGGNIYNGNPSFTLAGQSNSDLTWESVRGFDIGLDFRVLDHISATVDFYSKKTHDMLMEVPYSITTGYSSGWANVGSMQNKGVDVDVNVDIFKNKDWYVGAKVNFNYNTIEITELFNGLETFTVPNTGITYQVGKNPFSIHNVRYAGVDPRDGQQMWYTKDGNLTKVYDESNEVDLGKCYKAPWNGGFGFNARYKNISLNADFNWSAKKYLWDGNYWYTRTAEQCISHNGSPDLLNVWTKPGDVTDIPNLRDLYGKAQSVQADSRFVEDASFVRLKNLTVTYSLPGSWVKAMGLTDLNFHFTGRNLFTITSFEGNDPEYEANAIQFAYPNTRQFEFGVQVSF